MYDWLDKHIIEQASHYDVSPARLGQVMAEMADAQELVEQDGEPA